MSNLFLNLFVFVIIYCELKKYIYVYIYTICDKYKISFTFKKYKKFFSQQTISKEEFQGYYVLHTGVIEIYDYKLLIYNWLKIGYGKRTHEKIMKKFYYSPILIVNLILLKPLVYQRIDLKIKF
jgi:hypothetical protein